MALYVSIAGRDFFKIFYSTKEFIDGVNVVGYLIYPDATKSNIFTFTGMGDGIYVANVPYLRREDEIITKCSLVVKENGVVKKFEVVQISN